MESRCGMFRLAESGKTDLMKAIMSKRVAVVARLRPGSRDDAAQILADGPPYAIGASGLRRHSVFLGERDVVFMFEGPGVEQLVRLLVNDRAASSAFSRWGPLLEGTPSLCREQFYWER
jgi:hypothetical protein